MSKCIYLFLQYVFINAYYSTALKCSCLSYSCIFFNLFQISMNLDLLGPNSGSLGFLDLNLNIVSGQFIKKQSQLRAMRSSLLENTNYFVQSDYVNSIFSI